jgi:nucleoside phosphorylase/CheY-like chemotaxis protein
MLSVLVVEDDNAKYGRVKSVLMQQGVVEEGIVQAISSAAAHKLLRQRQFDMMILDINIPRRDDEGAREDEGVNFLEAIYKEYEINKPRYIVGLTAHEGLIEKYGDRFSDRLWTLVPYSINSDQWASRIKSQVEYIDALKRSDYFSDGITYGTDLAVICALEDVEFEALRNTRDDWASLKLPHDETRYITCNIEIGGTSFSVVAAAAPRMGMPTTSVLATKMICNFRPRYLAMVGICAGRVDKVHLGDIIVGDPCWDWGSGKISSVSDQPVFQPSPHHLDLDQDFVEIIRELRRDAAVLAKIKSKYLGPKPANELSVHIGPLASGAVVVADKPTFHRLLDQHRNLLGIDMEAYGIAVACRGAGKPRPQFFVAKAVSDFADKDKADSFQPYAAHNSAHFLMEAAKAFLPR